MRICLWHSQMKVAVILLRKTCSSFHLPRRDLLAIDELTGPISSMMSINLLLLRLHVHRFLGLIVVANFPSREAVHPIVCQYDSYKI